MSSATVETEAPPREQAAANPEKPEQKRQPPYAVILHNDNLNGFDFVVQSLRKVFRYEQPKARRLTLEAHSQGRTIVWSGALEHAELKADQLRSCGSDPQMKSRGALTLRVTIEPLPS